mgnify:CR=1 FL=1
MKITRRQLRKLINEVMVGYPDERAPFDATAALKSAKKKISKEPALSDMFDDDDDYDQKRQAYALGSMTTDLTDDEELAADMASDVIRDTVDPDEYETSYNYNPFDAVPGSEELDPDQRFFHEVDDYQPIEQALQGTVKDIIPELQISRFEKNKRASQDKTTYYTPDKKFQILMSFRPAYEDIEDGVDYSTPPQYTVEVRKYMPKVQRYEMYSPGPGSFDKFRDGTKAFFSTTSTTARFVQVLDHLRRYLEELKSL